MPILLNQSQHMPKLAASLGVSEAVQAHDGVILRVNPAGLAIIEDEKSHERYAVKFDKIVGYRGETPKRFGLVAGRQVKYRTVDRRVVLVSLQSK